MNKIAGTATAVVWFGASITFGIGTAQADAQSDYADKYYSAICSTISDYPSPGGVYGVVQGVVSDSGFSYYDAGRSIGLAVSQYCPENLPAVRRFVSTYGS